MGKEKNSAEAVLGRVLSSYGFTMQKELSDHLDIARNNISGWLQRDSIPPGVILQCSLDTGESVNWLVNGELEISRSNHAPVSTSLPSGKELHDLVLSSGGKGVVKRILDAYGFSTQKQLGDLLNISSGTMSAWIRRDYFPGDVVVTCALDTGASLLWLATGMEDSNDKNSIEKIERSSRTIPKLQFSSGELKSVGEWICDKTLIPNSINNPCYIEGSKDSWIIEQGDKTFSNGLWFVDIDGAIDLCEITRLPGNRINVKTGSTQFDCDLNDITPKGLVIVTFDRCM